MKKALIFGHTSGLGYSLSKKLLDEGVYVVGVARRESDIKSPRLVNLFADLSLESDVHRVSGEIISNHDDFDALLFCAGMLTSHSIDNLSFEQMDYMFRVNNFAPMTIESKLLDLIKANSADVVNVTSDASFNFYAKYHEYSASKVALRKFTQDLLDRLKDTPCRVMDFCPAGFQSNIRSAMTGEKVIRDESTYMRAEDLANIVYFLLNLPRRIEIGSIFVNRKAVVPD
jgi:short-subunit dehydrogenase